MTLSQSSISLLNQLRDIIAQLSNEDYTQPLQVLSGNTIGQHIRHILEFFLCLIDCENSHQINYDLRKHDKYLESDQKLARDIIHSIINFLESTPLDRPIDLHANYSIDEDLEIIVPSSLYREIAYNIEHTIHHMALIKIGVVSLNKNIVLPPNFGVASSTVRYQQRN
jgi:uncharacterized damage-inducible protein DinB